MRPHALAVPVAVVALGGAFARWGYHYGSGDHDELIPSVLAVLDPSLFTRDWLVQHVAHDLNVRSAFVWLVAGVARLLPGEAPVETAVALLWVGAWLGLALGAYALGWVLTRSRAAAAVGTVAAMVLTPAFTLGLNIIPTPLLTPEALAWTVAVPAVTLWFDGRRTLAGALFGLAAWMHLLAGLLPALALGLVALWRTAERAPGTSVAGLMRYGVAVGVAALPVVLVVLLSQGGASAGGPSPYEVHAVFRNPHHHLLSAFPAGAHVRFWTLMALGVAGLWAMRRWSTAPHAGDVGRLWIVIGALALVAAVFAERVPVEVVAKLQLFKLTSVATLVATLTAAGGAVAIARRTLGEAWPRVAWAGGWAVVIASVGVAAVLAGAAAGRGPLAGMVMPRNHAATDLAGIERWAREATPTGALFAVPPSVSTFRTHARRAVVANWNAFVFDDAAMAEWHARLMAVAPIATPPPRVARPPLLDAAYAARSASDWQTIRARYAVDYAVAAPGAPALPLPVAHAAGGWTVYALAP